MEHFRVHYIQPYPSEFRFPGEVILTCESYEKLKELFENSPIELIIIESLNAPYAEDWIERVKSNAIKRNAGC